MTGTVPITPQIHGQVPSFEGAVCTAILIESFVAAGEVISPANVTYIEADGVWNRLVLDSGTVHWRVESSPPAAWAVPEHDWEYPHTNLGAASGLVGDRIVNCAASALDGGCRVEIAFSSGRRLVLEEQADAVRYAVI